MQMEEATQAPSQSCIPLLSRLDHLEFIIKYLERKRKYCGNDNSASTEKQSLPPDLGAKDTCTKGLLLDRVISLEHRLFQLSLEMNSSSSSCPSSWAPTQTSGESSSSQGSKPELAHSLPTFNNIPTRQVRQALPLNHITTLQMQLPVNAEKGQLQMQNTTPAEQQNVKNKPKTKSRRAEKKTKAAKKQNPRSWPLLNLLGCT